MKIEQLSREDIPLILELESHSAPDKPYYAKYDDEALNFIFDNPDNCGAVGIFNGKSLVGWGAYRTNWKKHDKEAGVCEVSSIVVDQNCRREGLGSQLLKKILEIMSERKIENVFLTVSPLNVGALMLYLKNNFVIYDFRQDVYGPGSDRVYLKLIESDVVAK